MSRDFIKVRGAKENNLKNISVDIPKRKLTVITGLSGSGKSSLAFDTIFAEGQRRYMESLSSYARQFLGGNDKPEVDSIEGLSPAISIDQKTKSHNPRSTVGTVTELYDYIRLLYSRIGKPICPNGHGDIKSQSAQQIVDKIFTIKEKSKLIIMSPIVRLEKGSQANVLDKLRADGYIRVRVNGKVMRLDDNIELDKNKTHNIEVIIDRIILNLDNDTRTRITDAIEIALELSGGNVIIQSEEKERFYSEHHSCDVCGFSIPELQPRLFSFNSPVGACTTCKGLGVKLEADVQLIVPNYNISIKRGAIKPITRGSIEWKLLMILCEKGNIDVEKPFKDLKPDKVDYLMKGTPNRVHYEIRTSSGRTVSGFNHLEGVGAMIERRFLETSSERAREEYKKFMSNKPCPTCHGKRLNPFALAVKINDKDVVQVTEMSIVEASKFFLELDLTEQERKIAHLALKEIVDRLSFLDNVGLSYLSLSRKASTLSGGEAQRIRLATQIGSQLTDVLYVLDEPSIGLHPRDNSKLISTLENMKKLDNTILVVEHDEETMLSADYIIDIGPGAGVHGGEVIAYGTPDEIMKDENSITGQYLSGKKRIHVPKKRRGGNGKILEIRGCKENNLKNINAKFPLGKLIAVTGVSGSGKSSLINDTLFVALNNLKGSGEILKPGEYKEIDGIRNIDKVVRISQDSIGRTPRSNPATYITAFDDIRTIFAETPEAKMRGYNKGRFSYNVKGGRCEACRGDGMKKIEMHFLPDVYVICDQCKGKRYNDETLKVKFKHHSIDQILDMTCEESQEFFSKFPKLHRKLKAMNDVGLGYIKLGQPATQLSGGEAQRVKLAKYLQKRPTGKSVFILDEPTTGLHIHDTAKLIEVLESIVNTGNTVIVVEHNLDVVKMADYIIDMGPEGGSSGGMIIATGTPEQIANNKISYTGHYLKDILTK